MPDPHPSKRQSRAVRKLRPLKRRLRAQLLSLLRKQGLRIGSDHLVTQHDHDKAEIRAIHAFSRANRLSEERAFTTKWFDRVSKYFAFGREVDPLHIDPYPVLVEDDEELAALFRIASLWWSVPVSRGFGRRFRVLVFDRSNGKLFGLLGLTDPVFNLRTRDTWIGWDVRMRERNLAHVMDAYVLGAVPPYNDLLGAKFLALLATSDYIREIFRRRYGNSTSIIRQRKLQGRLAMVTATSALGKSSIYNRLRFGGADVFRPLGLTEGYGHFHLANGTFKQLRSLLTLSGDDESMRYKFGSGPNYRIRVARKALELLDLPPDLLRHGIRREVYVAPLAHNTAAFLRGEAKNLRWYHRPLEPLVRYWRERWAIPRSQRDLSYRAFNANAWREIVGLTRQES